MEGGMKGLISQCLMCGYCVNHTYDWDHLITINHNVSLSSAVAIRTKCDDVHMNICWLIASFNNKPNAELLFEAH